MNQASAAHLQMNSKQSLEGVTNPLIRLKSKEEQVLRKKTSTIHFFSMPLVSASVSPDV